MLCEDMSTFKTSQHGLCIYIYALLLFTIDHAQLQPPNPSNKSDDGSLWHGPDVVLLHFFGHSVRFQKRLTTYYAPFHPPLRISNSTVSLVPGATQYESGVVVGVGVVGILVGEVAEEVAVAVVVAAVVVSTSSYVVVVYLLLINKNKKQNIYTSY